MHKTAFCKADINALRDIMQVKEETQLVYGATDLKAIFTNAANLLDYVHILNINGVEAPWLDYDFLNPGHDAQDVDLWASFTRGEINPTAHPRDRTVADVSHHGIYGPKMHIESKGAGARRKLTLMITRFDHNTFDIIYDVGGDVDNSDFFKFACLVWVIDEEGHGRAAYMRYMNGRIVIGGQIQFVFNVMTHDQEINELWQQRDAGTPNASVTHSMQYRKYHVNYEESLRGFFYSKCVEEVRKLPELGYSGMNALKKFHGLGPYHELHTDPYHVSMHIRTAMYEYLKYTFVRCGVFANERSQLRRFTFGEWSFDDEVRTIRKGRLGFDCGPSFSGIIDTLVYNNADTREIQPNVSEICRIVGNNLPYMGASFYMGVSFYMGKDHEDSPLKTAVLAITPHLEFVFLAIEGGSLGDIVYIGNELNIHDACNVNAVNFSRAIGGTQEASLIGNPNHQVPALRLNADTAGIISEFLGSPNARTRQQFMDQAASSSAGQVALKRQRR